MDRAEVARPERVKHAKVRGVDCVHVVKCDVCGTPAKRDAAKSVDVCARCDALVCPACADKERLFVAACDNDACPDAERLVCPLCDATCDECGKMFCDACLRDWADDAAVDQRCACVRACLGLE